jgi:hypothetical protein
MDGACHETCVRPVNGFASRVLARMAVSATEARHTTATEMTIAMGQGTQALRCRQPNQPKMVMKIIWAK